MTPDQAADLESAGLSLRRVAVEVEDMLSRLPRLNTEGTLHSYPLEVLAVWHALREVRGSLLDLELTVLEGRGCQLAGELK